MTATEASRHFSDLLDSVERGESVTLTRGSRRIAEIRPAGSGVGRDLRLALDGVAPVDDELESDIAAAVQLLQLESGSAWGED